MTRNDPLPRRAALPVVCRCGNRVAVVASRVHDGQLVAAIDGLGRDVVTDGGLPRRHPSRVGQTGWGRLYCACGTVWEFASRRRHSDAQLARKLANLRAPDAPADDLAPGVDGRLSAGDLYRVELHAHAESRASIERQLRGEVEPIAPGVIEVVGLVERATREASRVAYLPVSDARRLDVPPPLREQVPRMKARPMGALWWDALSTDRRGALAAVPSGGSWLDVLAAAS